MAEGYVIVDLGMTPEEYLEALSTGQFTATEKQFNDIVNAIKSGKMMLAIGNIVNGIISLPASPYIITDNNGEITTVGYLAAPSMLNGNVASLLVYINKATLDGHVTPIILSIID